MPFDASPNHADDLRIRLLGGFHLWVGRRAVGPGAWRLRKAQSLVKLLALAPGHRLHREEVTDLLWPELGAAAAANNLKQALYVARRTLDAASGGAGRALRFSQDLLRLSPPGRLWIDVEAFEAAAAAARSARDPAAYGAAVELYTGDLLPEDRYEDWTAARREALHALYVALLVELAGLHEARGEPAAALEAWQRVVASEPAHEDAHVGLMRLYAGAGRRYEAMRQYRQLREALRREISAAPEAATERLYEDIVAGRFRGGRFAGR